MRIFFSNHYGLIWNTKALHDMLNYLGTMGQENYRLHIDQL